LGLGQWKFPRVEIRPIINASGAVTRLGGALMPEAVLRAHNKAAGVSVSMEELQAVAARRIAKVCGTESGLVTSGAAAGLTLGAAAILAGHDLGRMERLPHCNGFPDEFVIAREQRNGYDHAVRAAGARLVEVGMNEPGAGSGVRRTEAWEYEAAIGANTVGVLYVYGPNSSPPLAEVVAVAQRHQLPVLVDAAGELPPREHLQSIPATGADLVAFSGGKAIRGPQATGILCGTRDLISSAALQMLDMDEHFDLWTPPENLIDKSKLPGLPRHGIGRGLKVAKEEIAALLAALELFVTGAFEDDLPPARSRLQGIADALANAPVKCNFEEPAAGGLPRLVISVSDAAEAFEICRRLREGEPPVYVGHGRLAEGKLVIDPLCLDAAGAATLAERLRQLI
jgi:L-seryl-tRNA(Ser) seleniumtransferase